MHSALPVMPAELLQFEFLGHGFPVLGSRVIPTFALGALQRDDFSSLSRHVFSGRLASGAGRQDWFFLTPAA
jgi:hypothetical protein